MAVLVANGPVPPVRVLAEFGLLTGFAGGASGDHPQVLRPPGELVGDPSIRADAATQQPG